MADFMTGLGNVARTIGEGLTSFTTGTPLPQVQQAGIQTRLDTQGLRDKARLSSIVQGAQQLKQIRDPAQKIAFLEQRRAQLEQAGIPTMDTDEAIALARAGDFEGLESLTDSAIELGQKLLQGSSATGIQQAVSIPGIGFQTLSRQGEVGLKRLSEEDQAVVQEAFEAKAARDAAAAGLTEREKLIAKAEGEPIVAAAVKTAESGVELAFKPKIQAAVQFAEKQAASRGETLTDLERSEAAMPGLVEVIGSLKELAPLATSTLGGRIIDTAAKELGFGTPKGATARAKFIAIIDNQVLPLLKQTFGGSFTIEEGKGLKASMGDPDASPEEKIVQLESFIAQKQRDIAAKQRELGIPQTGEGTQTTTEFVFDPATGKLVAK